MAACIIPRLIPAESPAKKTSGYKSFCNLEFKSILAELNLHSGAYNKVLFPVDEIPGITLSSLSKNSNTEFKILDGNLKAY